MRWRQKPHWSWLSPILALISLLFFHFPFSPPARWELKLELKQSILSTRKGKLQLQGMWGLRLLPSVFLWPLEVGRSRHLHLLRLCSAPGPSCPSGSSCSPTPVGADVVNVPKCFPGCLSFTLHRQFTMQSHFTGEQNRASLWWDPFL